ncbi:MAG: PA2779 family protein [Bdellovibrionaceae bacterium]|nr:PA2779 family protein [Pseudobdellovibrionaceae bacterium]
MMFLPRAVRIYCAVFMAAIMTNIPYMAWAEQASQMIPTMVVVEQMSETQARQKVQSFLNREDFRKELVKRGVSPEEVSSRISSLSQSELRQLAAQMDKAQYGGDVGGILIVVVLVLLIIFLARRI